MAGSGCGRTLGWLRGRASVQEGKGAASESPKLTATSPPSPSSPEGWQPGENSAEIMESQIAVLAIKGVIGGAEEFTTTKSCRNRPSYRMNKSLASLPAVLEAHAAKAKSLSMSCSSPSLRILKRKGMLRNSTCTQLQGGSRRGSQQVMRTRSSLGPEVANESSSNDIFPEWMTQREDFRMVFTRYKDNTDDISETARLLMSLRLDPDHRTHEDAQHIANWMAKNAFLKPLGPKIHVELGRTVVFKEITAGTPIISEGDIGTEFFIIFSGAADVEVNGSKVAVLPSGKTFGEKALENNERRNATIRSNCPSQVIVVKATDYHKAMNKRAYQAKKQIIEVLSNHFVFGSAWTQSKILAMASVLTRHTYKLGQVLFDIGDESTGFVIVSSGAVGLKMLFEQTADNLWPAQDGLSEVCPYSKKIAVLVGQLGVGDFCGEDCVIGITRRQYRAVATAEDTEVFVVNQPDAIRFLSAEDIETIQEMTAEFYLPQAVIHKRCLESLRRKLLYSSLRDSAMGLKYKAMKSGLQERRKLQQRSPPRTHFVPRLSRGSATSRNEAAQEDESARPRFLSEPTEVLASRQSHQRASREFQQASGTTRSKNKKRISL